MTSCMKKYESMLKFARIWAFLDVWGGLFGFMLVLEIFGREYFCLPVTSGHYFITSENYTDQTFHR